MDAKFSQIAFIVWGSCAGSGKEGCMKPVTASVLMFLFFCQITRAEERLEPIRMLESVPEVTQDLVKARAEEDRLVEELRKAVKHRARLESYLEALEQLGTETMTIDQALRLSRERNRALADQLELALDKIEHLTKKAGDNAPKLSTKEVPRGGARSRPPR